MSLRARLEDAHQAAIVEYLATVLPFAEVVHIPNEGKRSAVEAARLKRLGLRKGAADLIVFLPGRVIAIECKRPADKLTKRRAGTATLEQLDFGANLNAMGHSFFIARGIEDVRLALKTLGVVTREATQ